MRFVEGEATRTAIVAAVEADHEPYLKLFREMHDPESLDTPEMEFRAWLDYWGIFVQDVDGVPRIVEVEQWSG